MINACAAASSADASDGRDRLSVEGHDAIFGLRVQCTGVRFGGCRGSTRVHPRRLRGVAWRMNIRFMKKYLSWAQERLKAVQSLSNPHAPR
jgi:hypothetical protein